MTYRVFNSKNMLVEISQHDLDDAARGDGALPAHLANAAGAARRHDLIDRLRATLGDGDRMNKLAAARALLTLDDRPAATLLREHAALDSDVVAARVFRAIALRIDGVEAMRRAFVSGDQNPELAPSLWSISAHSISSPTTWRSCST